jgi:hypothetical protein
MLWSVIVSLRRRYLEQQSELGGPEAILDPDLPAVSVPTDPPREPEPVTVSRKRSELVAPEAPGTEPLWRRDAPPIPGPGLTIDAPEVSLVDEGPASRDTLDGVAEMIAQCTACPLCQGRTNTVPGEGDPAARLMLVGEGPGAKEDANREAYAQ